MRNRLSSGVCGLVVVAVLMVAPWSSGNAATSRPHPLFGNSVLGNSAELVTMWPTNAGGVDSLRISDFMPSPPPGWLSPRPSAACLGGPTSAKYQQLDVATGDLDGDGRDDIVAAYTLPTANAWTQRVVLEVPDIRSGSLDWISGVSETQGDVALEHDAYRSPSNVRLATGNFDTDAPQEFVLGTRVQRNFHGEIEAYDYFGVSAAAIGDVDGDGVGDLAIGSSGDDDGGADRGSVWIMFLRSDGTVRAQQKISATQGGFTGTLDNSDFFGCGVAALGDHDHDGVPDIAVGAYGDDDGGSARGAVWLLHLNRDGTVKSHLKISSTEGMTGTLDNSDYFGIRITSLGDFDGDGTGDLAVAATGDDDGGADRGAVYLLFSSTGFLKISDSANTPPSFALDNSDQFGFGLAYFSDFDGLGNRVLAIGAPYDDDGGADRGAVWLMFLDETGVAVSFAKISSTSEGFGAGLDNGDQFGRSIAAVPDRNGDGVGDLAVGAAYDDDGGTNRGALYLVYTNASGTVTGKEKISDTEGNFTGTLGNDDRLGESVICLDQDGRLDLVVGAVGADVSYDLSQYDAGDLWFMHLGTGLDPVIGQMENGTWWDGMLELRLMELDGSGHPVTLASLFGQAQGDEGLKESTRFDIAAGDFDGDGIDEIAVGGVRRRTDNGNMELFVTIYAYDGGELVERATTSDGNQPAGGNGLGLGNYFDHVAIATGHLRSDLTDQILFSWSLRQAEWYEHVWGCGAFDNEWELYHTMTSNLATLVVDPTGGLWTIGGWGVDGKTKSLHEQVLNTCGGRYDPEWTGPSLGLSVGDLTGDGMDEVAWATLGSVYVYQLNGAGLDEKTSVSRWGPGGLGSRAAVQSCVYNDPARRVVEIADLDAASGAAGWRPELIVQDWGAASSAQRIRIFQAIVNSSGVITSLAPPGGLLDIQVPMTHGDVALACGDFDGDGFRLGVPTLHSITDVVQPAVILGAPPIHFDEFEQPYDITGCYPGNGTYVCDDFKANYTKETSVEFALQTEVREDWGLSSELKANLGVGGFSCEASLKATYGEGFSRTSGASHVYQVTTKGSTSGGDRILADVVDYDMWEYPVYRAGQVVGHIGVMDPVGGARDQGWYSFDEWTSMFGAGGAPAIMHEPGNILSYPKATPGTGVYGDTWKADGVGWPVDFPGTMSTLADYGFDLQWSDISGSSFSRSWYAGIEVGASVAYEAGDPFGIVKVGASLSVAGSYGTSEMATRSVSIGEDIHIGATLGYLGGPEEARYRVKPFVYRSSTTGALVLDYEVTPGGAGTWWDIYRGRPDLTFILPRLHREAKGYPTQDPTTKYRSPDVRVYPGTAAVGDTVTIRAIVRNFGLFDHDGAVPVRFYAGDPDGAHIQLHDITGQGDFSVSDIPSRESKPVSLQWIVPSFMPDTARIYAEVDPDGAINEIHENNNKGYVEFYAIGGNPLDVPAQVAVGVPFRLEQSVPNPFHNSALIAFGLPERTRVTLNVYDIAGRMITTLVDEELAPGRHEFRWDGRGRDGEAVRPGIYLYRIKAGAFGETRRIVRIN